LLPRLRKEGGYQLATLRPGAQPFYSLAESLVVLLEPGLSKTDLLAETRNLAERLAKREVGLAEVVRRIQKDLKDKLKVLLVVDQFEELYTMCTDADLQVAFIDELLATVEASKTQRGGAGSGPAHHAGGLHGTGADAPTLRRCVARGILDAGTHDPP
jgi:hypothetical protein